MREEDIDVLAVQRDDELLDALAARGPVPAFAAYDPVAGLLAALAADVDDDLGPATPFGGYALAGMAPVRRHRRLGRRTVLAVGVAGAVLSASGVAAAVSGDPFAPIRPIGKAIGDLKPAKVTPAQVDKELDGADAALGRGDHRTARELLEKAREKAQKLSGPEGEAARQRLAQLEAALAAQTPIPSPDVTRPATPAPTPGGTTPGADPTLTKEQLKEQKKKAKEEERRKKKEEPQKGKDGQKSVQPTTTPTPAPEPTGPSSTSANLIDPPPT